MSTFVLVYGSWHDGSAWKAVIQHLEAKGHQAFAPTIAGHGKAVNKNVNHAQCTQSIVDYIIDQDLTDIVLLGHSFGGTIIAKVAEAISDREARSEVIPLGLIAHCSLLISINSRGSIWMLIYLVIVSCHFKHQ